MSNPETAINPTPISLDIDRARASLQQSLARYTNLELGAVSPTLQSDLDTLAYTLTKLEQTSYSIAVFGLVSRGKSAVLNALIGEKILEVGPLNGVTRFPRQVRWSLDGLTQIDLIDTPGLDEIDGEARATMAAEVVNQADLILFIIAGDITQLEYQALRELRQAHKPLLLVFNKSDLYPEQERQTIYQQLQSLSEDSVSDELLQRLLSADEVVMVAADPTPIQVRIEYPDGTKKYEWEKPAPQIEPLRTKIQELLAREGKSLLAINALVQARAAESSLAKNTLTDLQAEANDLVRKFAGYKAIAVTANPIAIFDLFGGVLVDLLLIRSLAKLYNLPTTKYELVKLLNGIVFSSASLLLGEVATGIIFGVGKTTALLVGSSLNVAAIPGYLGAGAIQGAVAGYGAYRVGKAAQIYLAKGSTWGQLGANTVIQEILDRIDDKTIISRLRDELLVKPNQTPADLPSDSPTS
ncbi:GTP-binding protein [Chamaesiphon sp. VAR_69_metabat_338]|uniref:GTP-binding protein n=1 Tax=Chamaesiphon sp. VAR_69_metabat_338 TaxID=2964704 RepID=UPI00286E6415|nr:GTP-binding protein [Chamaesiphon sp. VAR_69_metabat_338]